LARKALEKNGENALADWGQISLFYGCRSQEDFLYSEEWPGYVAELKGKFKMHTAFSRSGSKKVYVQDLMWEDREHLAKAIAEQKGYIYICGDGHSMSKDVEEKLARILGEAKGGTVEDGVKDVKLLKERSRLLMDVWS
jgi:NADPH-ferrihemoprotein reductase